MSFLAELKRRHVYRVAILYLVVALALLEGTDLIQGNLDLPSAVNRFVTIASIAGFPIAILLAWVYDLKSKGIERTEPLDDETVPTSLVVAILASLAVVLAVTGIWLTRTKATDVAPTANDGANTSEGVTARDDRPSIVVLPFLNLSDETDQEFFADGITEDLTTDLSKVADLFVIARSSAFTYKGRRVEAKVIGKQLGVRYLLEGSVRKLAGRARITAQLIDAVTGFHVWSERYDRELDDLFEIQNEINEKILAAMRVTIAEVEMARIRRQPMESLSAYEAWHKGRTLLRKFTREDVLEGRRLLERAVELQPDFSEAYSELSNSYLAEFHTWNLDRSLLKTAFELGRKGLALNALSPIAHVNLALIELAQFNPEEAARLARRAVELAPSDFTGYSVLGGAHLVMQQRDEAIENLELAVRLNPLAPDVAYSWLASALYFTERRQEAVDLWERVRSANPEAITDRLGLAMHYQRFGDVARAQMIVEEILAQRPDYTTEEAIEIFEIGHDSLSEEELEEIRTGLLRAGLP